MTGAITAYPLCWPVGRPRTRFRTHSSFKTSEGKARDELLREIERLGGRDVILSTNMPLRQDGLPYSSKRLISDSGVAVYFTYKKKPVCFACDKFNAIGDNMHAIGKTIEALRGIARWGTGDMMDRAFTGFEALPAPAQWWDVLGFATSNGVTTEQINDAYRRKAMDCHPDRGGNSDDMANLNWARDAGLEQIAA